jgi:hypothetical protein
LNDGRGISQPFFVAAIVVVVTVVAEIATVTERKEECEVVALGVSWEEVNCCSVWATYLVMELANHFVVLAPEMARYL